MKEAIKSVIESRRPETGGGPLVTVIMPAYNHEKYVERAIQSLWDQDYPWLEIVVLDDGSTDGTLNVLQHLFTISPVRMVLIEKKNEGICKTLNRGLDYASGKYVSFLASDDEYDSRRISLHVEFLENGFDQKVAGCYGDYQIIDENNKLIREKKCKSMGYEDQFLLMISRKNEAAISASTFFSNVVKEIKFDPNIVYEDWDFFLRLSENHCMAYVPGVTFRYRDLEAGLHRNVEKIILGRAQILDKFQNHGRVIKYGVKKFATEIALLNAQAYFNVLNFQGARKWVWKAVSLNPFIVLGNLSLVAKIFMGKRLVALARVVKRHL